MSELLVAGMAYLDLFVPRFAPPPAGQELFVDSIKLDFGGVANSASVAAALGVKVVLCAPAGNGIADEALARLAARLGIDFVALPASDDPAISLVLSDTSDRSFVSAACFRALDQVTHLPQATWIHVPGLEEAARLEEPLWRARLGGARIAVSASWVPQRLAHLARMASVPWDLLVLNENEATAACGDAARAPLLLTGAASSVVVTMGASGAFGVLDGESVRVAAAPVQVADTTGAGDAFCAGLLACLLRAMAPQTALQFAARSAAHILQQRGGVLQDPVRIASLASEIPWRC